MPIFKIKLIEYYIKESEVKQDIYFFMTAKINKNSIEMLKNNLEDLQAGKGKTKG